MRHLTLLPRFGDRSGRDELTGEKGRKEKKKKKPVSQKGPKSIGLKLIQPVEAIISSSPRSSVVSHHRRCICIVAARRVLNSVVVESGEMAPQKKKLRGLLQL